MRVKKLEDGRALEVIREMCHNLLKWFEKNNYMGHDPYQIPRYEILSDTFFKYFPSPSLVFAFLPRLLIPEALGLIIRANASLYKVFGNSFLIRKNSILIETLLDYLKESGYNGWGVPFKWKSGFGLTYPKDYPFAIVSAEIGHSLLDQYILTKQKRLLATSERIAEFLLAENGFLRIGNKICFYYSSLDKYLVNNVNTYVASFLIKLGYLKRLSRYFEIATKAIDYTLSQQNADGSWYYYAYPFCRYVSTIDNRHTGYTLVSLKWANAYLKSEKIQSSINSGWRFYKNNFLLNGTIPKHRIDKIFPIDIHDAAQVILTSLEMGEPQIALATAKWVIENMSNKENEFYFKMYRDGKVVRISSARWSQAWMYRALTFLLEKAVYMK